MKFRIPFTSSNLDKLKKRSKFFATKFRYKRDSKLGKYLYNCDINITREEYLGICTKNFIIVFIYLFMLSSILLIIMKIKHTIIISFGLSLIFAGFVYFSQRVYPKVYQRRKQKNIEKNLIPALEDMLIQTNSGVPLFTIMMNISDSDYGELSKEFKKAVKKISAGQPEAEVLTEIGKKNSSVFFQRTLWQISNGIIAGSEMAIVIQDSIKALNEEQMIQIQKYGNSLNPLIMFYMIISVILPSISIAFITVLSSMMDLPKTFIKFIFIGLMVIVIFMQIMFLGIIKSKRPSLL